MSAFGNTSGGDSGLGSLLGVPASSASTGEQNEGEQQVERATQLEREVSTLTNENLKLKEQNAELQQQLEDNIGLQEPSDLIESNKRLINDEISAKVNEQMEQKESEND